MNVVRPLRLKLYELSPYRAKFHKTCSGFLILYPLSRLYLDDFSSAEAFSSSSDSMDRMDLVALY